MKKPKNKNTKAYKEWEIHKLENKCLKLWKEIVKLRTGNCCEICKWLLGKDEKKNLQAHHIEDYRLNKRLRYDSINGVAVCPKHHKFGLDSFHKSFVFAYTYLMTNRSVDIEYLSEHRDDGVLETKEYFQGIISDLESQKEAFNRKRSSKCQ